MTAEELRAIYERMAEIRSGEVPSMVGDGLVGGGKYRSCARKKKVYSKALGKKVTRCSSYKKAKGGGKYRTCADYEMVPSKKLGHPVKRCSAYVPNTVAEKLGLSIREPKVRGKKKPCCPCPASQSAELIKESAKLVDEAIKQVVESPAVPIETKKEVVAAAEVAEIAKELAKAASGEEVSATSAMAAGLVGGCSDCMGAGRVGSKCMKYKRVPSKYGHKVKRCSYYGGAMVGGDEANKLAAARSPWLAFVRMFALEHPELAHDRPMLLKEASRAYRM